MTRQTRDLSASDFERRFGQIDTEGLPRSVSALARSAIAFASASGDTKGEAGFLAFKSQSISLGKDGGDFIAACYYYLTSLGCPSLAYDFVLVIAALTSDQPEDFVPLTDVLIAGVMNISERQVRKKRAELKIWMLKENFQVLEIVEGEYNHKTKRYDPTRYRATLSAIAARIVLSARQGSLWKPYDTKSQRKALQESAAETVWQTPEAPTPVKERKKRKERDSLKEIQSKRKTILTLFQKSLRLEFKRGGDPASYVKELMMDIESLYREEMEIMEETGGVF